MLSNVRLTKEARKDVVDISGKRFDQVTSYSKDDMASMLQIDPLTFKFYCDWYLIDNKLYYFKSDYMFNEIFLSELAHELGIKCVDFKLSDNGKFTGIISESFRRDGFNYYDYMELEREFFLHDSRSIVDFKYLASDAFGEDESKKLLDEIYKLIAFDVFTGQFDRVPSNVTFELDSKGNIELAPLCDNGAAFNTTRFNTYRSCFGDLAFPVDKYIDSCQLETLKLVRDNLAFYNEFEKLVNINVKDVLERTLEKYKLKMSESKKCDLYGFFDEKKDSIERTLAYSKKI